MSKASKRKEELSKGLSSLLGTMNKDAVATITEHTNFSTIPISNIDVNTNNPRHHFEERSLQELAESIKLHGLIQPITVTKIGNRYQLISGERRWRAAQLAGIKQIPAYIREGDNQEIVEWALIENLQREDLNPIEVAICFQRMIEELNYTQEQLASRIGKQRSTITNMLRLLKLPPDIQLALKKGTLSVGNARALINLPHIDLQLALAKKIQNQRLSVRETEILVKKYTKDTQSTKTASAQQKDVHTKEAERQLASQLDAAVKIQSSAHTGEGKIVISFKTMKDLNRLLDLMQ